LISHEDKRDQCKSPFWVLKDLICLGFSWKKASCQWCFLSQNEPCRQFNGVLRLSIWWRQYSRRLGRWLWSWGDDTTSIKWRCRYYVNIDRSVIKSLLDMIIQIPL